jgi:hypothetical protein
MEITAVRIPNVGGLAQSFSVLAKNYSTEAAPLSAVFGRLGFRPLKPYDFVAAFEVAVSAGGSITADSANAVQSSTNHNLCSRNPRPFGLAQGRLFEPREDRGSRG